MSALPERLTFEEFLEWEQRQPARHEFVGGRIVPWNVDAQGFAGPTLIVEVLSPSTANEDLEDKYDEYTPLETLAEYLVVDSRKRWARLYRRSGDRWVVHPVTDERVAFASINVTLDFVTTYEGIALASPASESAS